MSTAKAGMVGEAPTVLIETPKNPLQEVYERCYSEEAKEYRNFSPGEKLVNKFWDTATFTLDQGAPFETQTLIDYGCGTGRASLALSKRGLKVTALDFAENCLDPHVKEALDDDFQFQAVDITKPLPEGLHGHFGYCCDVLEHLEPEQIRGTVEGILERSKYCFFQISCVEDHFGNHPHIKADNDELHLHLTVWDYDRWLKEFSDMGCVVLASWDNLQHAIFFVTATRRLHLDPANGVVNVHPEKLRENVRENVKLGLQQIGPCETQETEVMLLAGGPSLNEFEDEIIQNRKEGMKLITVNGTYNWAIERGLEPSLQVIADSREFNQRFTVQSELTENTKYLISSSADPSIFDNVPHDRTYLMHCTLDPETFNTIVECFGGEYEKVFPIPGGSTVTLRALAALRMLGFYKLHVYGFDSCIPEANEANKQRTIVDTKGREWSVHHAYDQPENDEDSRRAKPITIAGGSDWERTFLMAPWHVYQCQDFIRVSEYLLRDANVAIYGDGAIAHIINTAAAFASDDVEEITEAPGPIVYTLRPIEHSRTEQYARNL
jgi:SAM-dependent methyltransferase